MSFEKILKYCPKLNGATGSVTASILMCQLEYWFEKMNGKPFYKFLEPCEDRSYKSGDSWTEELGFSRFEFRTAFSKIGVAYPSKTAYLKSKDPFQGKLYLSYRDRVKKRTYYVRNTKAVCELLRSLGLSFSQSKETSQVQTASAPTVETKTEIPYEQIVACFHKACPDLPQVTRLTPTLKKKLSTLWVKLESLGKDGLATLEEAFNKVQQSDFLCGRTRKSQWHAVFEWILQPDKFFAILKDKYAPLHEPSLKPKALPTFLRVENHHFDLEQLERLEQNYHWHRFYEKSHNISPNHL